MSDSEAGKNGDATEQPPASAPEAEKKENGVEPAVVKPDVVGQPSGRTMFVLNIPTARLFTLEQELQEIFSKYGEIKSVKRAGLQIDGPATETTLSAYIHFSSVQDAENALAGEQGLTMDDNVLQLFVLKITPTTVVADSLPVVMSVDCIRNLLSPCGAIKDLVKIPGRRTAFIEFEDEEGSKKALTLNGKLMINNVKIVLETRTPDSQPVVQQPNQTPNNQSTRPPMQGGPKKFARRGGYAPRGGGPPRPPVQPFLGGGFRGGRGGRGGGGGRGGFRGGPSLGYGGDHGGGGYWGEYNMNHNDNPMKRRKLNNY